MSEQTFIEGIIQQYPKRILRGVMLEYAGFTAHFDLPKQHSLKVSVSIFAKAHGLEVHEIAQETSYMRVHNSEVNPQNKQAGTKADVLPLLRTKLKQVLGDAGNTYEGSFASAIVETADQPLDDSTILP